MPWQYSQKTGELTHDGEIVGRGYSGKKGMWKDNPAMEMIRDKGPIPRGKYSIGAARHHPKFKAATMRLTPIGHRAHGRTDFLIHSDSIKHPGDASQGCIVLALDIRKRIAASGDTILNVVE